MTQFFKLNFPVETDEARAFWASRHKCNQMKAIIAFSYDLENANTNLKRAGYRLTWRDRALQAFHTFVNQPDMKNIPFTPDSVPWWECMPYLKPTYGPPVWVDERVWDDTKHMEDL